MTDTDKTTAASPPKASKTSNEDVPETAVSRDAAYSTYEQVEPPDDPTNPGPPPGVQVEQTLGVPDGS